MRKYIFLDFDGVLNNKKSKKDTIESHLVELLNYIIEATNALVVVSSSWRKNHSVIELQQILENKEFKGKVIDVTPCLYFQLPYTLSVPRGCEIKAWLEANKQFHGAKMSEVKYVIIDDDTDMLYWHRNNFVQTNSIYGLTKEDVDKAIQILNS